jgi:hypothetical protein
MVFTRTGFTAPRTALLAAALGMCLAAAVPARALAAKPAVGKNAPADSVRSRAAAPRSTGVRTLDAINIDGEIAVPQVLFITARDVRRYRDGLSLKFQLNAIEAGRSAVLPSRLRVVQQPQTFKEEGK